jgi:hypothetical protein
VKLCEEEWQPPLDQGFALLEPSNWPHILEDGALSGTPCTPYGLEKIAHLMPQLIDLRKASASDRECLQDLCLDELNHVRPPFMCAWIVSEAKEAELAAQVAELLVGFDGRRRVIWRYYDPRVMSLAYSVLTPSQRDALLYGIQRWVLPWSARWWSIDGHRGVSKHLERVNQGWPAPDQWKTIAHSGLVHRIHVEVCTSRNASPKDAPGIQMAIIAGMNEAANTLRLEDPAQQAEYARLLVLYGDKFRHHRLLGSLRTKLANGGLMWAEFQASVNEEELERLVQGICSYSSL